MPHRENAFRKPLETASSVALSYLDQLDTLPVAPTAGLHELRARLAKPLNETEMDADQVIRELAADVEGGVITSAGGRFFGWVIGGALPAALAADWLTSTWDQNAGLYAGGPAAAIVEEVAGAWLKEIFGLPATASFALVTGCQMAHTTCLMAARHSVLQEHGWNVEERGLFGAPRIRVLSSTERHGTFERAIRFVGIGLRQVAYLPADEQGRLRPEILEQALQEGADSPTIVLLQAGDVNIGAYDPFETLVPIAKRYGAWVHVDGAFGLWAAASPKFRHLLKGVEQADSWATDGHKWLNVPYDCGYALVADSDAHLGAMTHRAAYLTHAAHARDQVDWTPESSRRARGFATYAALRQLGRRGVADLVERCSRLAHLLVTRIGSLPGAELVWEPTINQGLVRFGDDRRTDEVIAAIAASGEAFFGGTTWRGRRAMRVSVCNWQTSEQDIDRVLAAVSRVLQA